MSRPVTVRDHQEHVDRDGGFSATLFQVDLLDRSAEPPIKLGEGEMEFCTTCGFRVAARCNHTTNEWVEQGSKLQCKACKADVT